MENANYNRLMEKYIVSLFDEIPAISLDGLKGVGKTLTCKNIANTVFELELEGTKLLIENNVEVLDIATKPILIDEWQKVPSTWEFVRRRVDDDAGPGSYLLTGSASAKDLDVHSGAGRIIRLRMMPLSIEERAISEKAFSLGRMLETKRPYGKKVKAVSKLKAGDYLGEIIRSGLPGVRRRSEQRRNLFLTSYLNNLLSHDFEMEGIRIRQPAQLRKWLASYAAAIATDTNYNEILDASTAGESDKLSRNTTIAYREALEKLWLIDELSPWFNGENYFARLKQTTKHYFAEPAIACNLLGITKSKIMTGEKSLETKFDKKYGNILGRLFESLVYQSLKTYAIVNEATIAYMKTRNGDREVDFIIENDDKIIGIESKLAARINDKDVSHLKWLKRNIKGKPVELIVINAGNVAYKREDGIYVIPLALFGA